MKPPVSRCRARVARMWRAQDRGCSIAPNMMVTFERSPTRVGGAVGLEPLLGVDLVGAQHGADLVVEDLGRGAGQGRQPGVAQAGR